MSFEEAYKLLKKNRPNIDPNIGFVSQLKSLEEVAKEKENLIS
jgi:hypothetical protein